MKIILNTYKICEEEQDKFIIIKLDEAEGMYNLYQNKIAKAMDEIKSNNIKLSYSKEREIKNLESNCNQIVAILDSNNIPYTLIDNNGIKTLKINQIAVRTRYV